MLEARNKLLLEEKMGKLLFKLSAPAMVGMFVSASYNLVDTIFIGQGVGTLGIAGVSIALPITMIIMGIALTVGVGGASLISRALGAKDTAKAERAMGNSFALIIFFSLVMTIAGLIFARPLVMLFGANEEILPYAYDYIKIIFYGAPFFAFMVGANHLIRAEGNARTSMIVMIMSAILNTILDPIFIFSFGWGIKGAALATIISQFVAFVYMIIYFYGPKSLLRFHWENLKLKAGIVKEILTVGFSTFTRQLSMSLMAVIINHSLNVYGGSIAIAAFGIINRLLIFTMMPLFGIIQGFQPIAGFNHGAGKHHRVKEVVKLSVKIATHISIIGFVIMMFFIEPLTKLFTRDPALIQATKHSARMIIILLPFIGFQTVVGGLYQALGKARPALFLSLLRQIILLVPLVLILPIFWGLNGVLLAFPASDLLAVGVTYWMFKKEMKLLI